MPNTTESLICAAFHDTNDVWNKQTNNPFQKERSSFLSHLTSIKVAHTSFSDPIPPCSFCLVLLEQGEQYGRLLATELLQSFIKQNSTRLVQSYLRVTEGAQQFFKGFNSHVRGAVENAVISLMVHCE